MKNQSLLLLLFLLSLTMNAQNPGQILAQAAVALEAAQPSKAQALLDVLPKSRWSQAHYEMELDILYYQEKFKEILALGANLDEKYVLSDASEQRVLHALIETGAIYEAHERVEQLKSSLSVDEYQLAKGMVSFHSDDYAEAAFYFENAITLNPESSMAWSYIGLVLEQEQQLPKALEAFANAQRLNRQEVAAYHGSARILASQQKVEAALETYLIGVQNNPESLSLLLSGAQLAMDQKQYSLVRTFSTQALKVNPRLAAAHSNCGMSYFLEQNYQDAIPHLNSATQYRNDGADHYYLGLAAIRTRSMDQAHRHLEMALSLGFEREDLPQLVEHCRSILASFDTDEHRRPY